MLQYKQVENVSKSEECFTKCAREEWCIDAVFTFPRRANTFDLHSLYNKVINADPWIRESDLLKNKISEQKGNGPHASQDDTDVVESGPDQYFPLINATTTGTTGSCYLYDNNVPLEQKFQCKPGPTPFQYNFIECEEDVFCTRPKRRCPCGRCGRNCKECMFPLLQFFHIKILTNQKSDEHKMENWNK